MVGRALTLLAALGASALDAQTTVTGTYRPPPAKYHKYSTLSVRYPAVQNATMILSASGGFKFSCAVDMPMIPPNGYWICRAVVPVTGVKLTARWMVGGMIAPNAGNIGDAQWGGACAGTQGTTCSLDMTNDQLVTIDPTKPGPPPKPMPTTSP